MVKASPDPRTRRVLLAVSLATLAIFGGLLLAITLNLRAALREEVLRREAEAIHAVALMQLERTEEERLALFAAEFAMDDLFAAVLESSRLKRVLAVQLFDRDGELQQAQPLAPDNAAATRWWPADLAEPQARFFPRGTLDLVSPQLAFENPRTARATLLEIAVPLRGRASDATPAAEGVARYWLDGGPVAGEFARMDRRLAWQAGGAFAGGALLILIVLAWASARLAAANRRLVEQSADLARANEELDFAAKTGALGAISAHLIHGLKNPLAGLEGFVAEGAAGRREPAQGEAWHAAVETTRRLRALVSEVSTVLGDEANGDAQTPLPVREIVAAVQQRTAPTAERAGVHFQAIVETEAHLGARTANLASLVLANLIANAIEATEPRGGVTLVARHADGRVEFTVRDAGPGLPDAVRATLFRPVRSTKRGGGGMGLAISHRLAKHAGGELELVRSDEHGTEFRLRVPAAAG